jgi:hypothetical protein
MMKNKKNIKIQPSQEDLQIIKLIRPMVGHTLSGFAQGEGSFHLIIRQRKDFFYGFRFTLAFSVGNKDSKIVSLYKTVLKCGNFRQSSTRSDDPFYIYEVDSSDLIVRRIIPFFKRFGFFNNISASNFSIFSRMAALLTTGQALTVQTICELLRLRNRLHNAVKSKKTDLYVLTGIESNLQLRLNQCLLKNNSNVALQESLQKECDFVAFAIKKMQTFQTSKWVWKTDFLE